MFRVTFEEQWIAVLLATARIGAFLFTLPFFRGMGIPYLAKGALALNLAFFSTIGMETGPGVTTMSDLILRVMMEVGIGLFLSYAIEVITSAVRMAGALIDMDIGLANPIFDPTSGGASTILSKIFFSYFILIFIGMNGVSFFVGGLMHTFQFQVPGAWFGDEAFLEYVVDLLNSMFLGAVQIAFPFMFATFLVNLTLLFMGKTVDKINIFMSMFGIKILVGLVLVAISLPILTTVFQQVYEMMDERFVEGLQLLFK